jgi:methylglutamate dehydrogenase subunit D
MTPWRRFLPEAALTARSAFAGIALMRESDRLAVTDRDGLGIASLSLRRGREAELQQRFTAQYGAALPEGPRRVPCRDGAVMGAGPGSWLLFSEGGANALSRKLKSVVGDSGSVADQSDAWAVLRLAGVGVRDLLSHLVPLDLHPRMFPVGAAVSTVLLHMGALVWRLDDEQDGRSVFELAVYRSYARSLYHEIAAHSL